MYKMNGENGEVMGHVPITFFRLACRYFRRKLLYRMTIEISLSTSINTDGHLKTDIQQCLVYVGDMIFDFAANDAEMLKNYAPFIQTALRDQAGMVRFSIFLQTCFLATMPNIPCRTCAFGFESSHEHPDECRPIRPLLHQLWIDRTGCV